MKRLSLLTLVLALGTGGSIAYAQSAPMAAPGAPSRVPPEGHIGTPGLGTPSAGAPGSTGGSHTPGTSASGAPIECAQAQEQAIEHGSGSAGTGSSSGPARPREGATSGDCPPLDTRGSSVSEGDGRSPDSTSEATGITDKSRPFGTRDGDAGKDKGKD